MNTFADRVPRWTGLKGQLNSRNYIIKAFLPTFIGLLGQYINMGKYPVHPDPVYEVLILSFEKEDFQLYSEVTCFLVQTSADVPKWMF